MDRWRNKIAVVTGASAGIGVAIVKDFLKSGIIVVGLARRVDRMQAIKESLPKELQKSFHFTKCDVSDQNSVKEAFSWIEKQLGSVHILINNAGKVTFGNLSDSSTDYKSVLDTNVLGIIYCTQEAVRSMKAHNVDGHIVLINSVTGHKVFKPPPGLPSFNIYSASKYAVTAMGEIFKNEFDAAGSKIKITNLSPGTVATEIVEDISGQFDIETFPYLKVEDVSNAVLYVIGTPPNVQIKELTIQPLGEHI